MLSSLVVTGQERGAPKAAVSPFGGAAKAPAGPANPFGSSSSPRPFIEPSGMSPDMQQYPMSTEPWWKQITLTQVVRSPRFSLHVHQSPRLEYRTMACSIIVALRRDIHVLNGWDTSDLDIARL